MPIRFIELIEHTDIAKYLIMIIAIPQITANIHNSETTHYNPKYKLFPEHF